MGSEKKDNKDLENRSLILLYAGLFALIIIIFLVIHYGGYHPDKISVGVQSDDNDDHGHQQPEPEQEPRDPISNKAKYGFGGLLAAIGIGFYLFNNQSSAKKNYKSVSKSISKIKWKW